MHRFALLVISISIWAVVVMAVVVAEAMWFWRPSIARGEIAAIEGHMVRALSDAAADRRLGSACLVLMHRGEIVGEHAFGIGSFEANTPPRPERTLYQVASVSKAVTAWGVMALVQNGKLGLDEPVVNRLRRWRFPDDNGYGARVTVRHLLSHTAGLDDGLGYGGFGPGETAQTLEESLTDAKDSTVGRPRGVKVVRPPGMRLSYSGGGYTVLQLLIEEVTHQPFADSMRDAVLRPLGMRTATFDIDAAIAAGHAPDLATAFGHDVKPRPHRRHSAKAAVALLATPRDMAQFLRAFVRPNRVLRPETLEQMLLPQPGTSGAWGLGLQRYAKDQQGGQVVGHDGGSPPAWGSMLRVNPRSGNGMVLLVSGGAGAVNQLGHDWVYWETGEVTEAARRQEIYSRIVPTAVVIIIGWVAIGLWLGRRRTLV